MSLWDRVVSFFRTRGQISDKALHVFVSFCLAVLFVIMARAHYHPGFNGVIVAFLFGLLWEVGGKLFFNRQWDWKDILANTGGCLIGSLMTGAWK